MAPNARKIAPNEIEKCLKIWDGECPPWEAYEYVLEKNKTEGQMLFNYVRKNGADKLWAGKAWQNKTCKRICSYGEFCKKRVVSINENKMCYGQLLYNDLSLEKLKELDSGVKLLSINGDIINVDLESFFYVYECYYEWFGCKKSPKRYYGDNCLLPLLALKEEKKE